MKKNYIYIIAVLALAIGLFGISFGYLKDIKQSSANTQINLSNFGVGFAEGYEPGEVTFPSPAYPMNDAEGLTNPAITFRIQNIATVDASYKLSLVDGQVPSTMLNKDAKYQLKKGVNGATPTVVGIFNLADSGIIDEGTIKAGETIDYELIIWIDYNANPNGLTFSKYIKVEGMQLSSLDESEANFPELADNMIPVYYEATSTTEGVWKKADSTNGLDSTTLKPTTTANYPYKWFDYKNQMWANAVTVKETGTHTRDYYLNADLGTTIEMDDITTMWVWIPRYKYVIFNGNNGTAEEQMINVIFEHGKETTGTVKCVDNIQGEGATSSETCTDTTNNGITNNKSTYTHPAFTFGSEELTGFWISKFFVSTDDTSCVTNYNGDNCNKIDVNLYIKPGEYAYTYTSHYRSFGASRKMELYNNIHGFNQSENATSYMDSNNYLTGNIPNDSNNIDIHLIKNMEWGAVAYLYQSRYGKYGNSMYSDQYKEIYINSAYDVYNTTDKKYLTGYSSNATNADYTLSSSNNVFAYNDLTNQGSGRGYKGAGASSTGTIYGVYDLNTRIYNIIMGNVANTTGKFGFLFDSQFWSESIHPVNKYFDQYSYIATEERVSNIGKLGDATKETQNGTTSWQAGFLGTMPSANYPFMLRSVNASSNSNSSIYFSNYTVGGIGGDRSFHTVLTISRNTPWKDNNNS